MTAGRQRAWVYFERMIQVAAEALVVVSVDMSCTAQHTMRIIDSTSERPIVAAEFRIFDGGNRPPTVLRSDPLGVVEMHEALLGDRYWEISAVGFGLLGGYGIGDEVLRVAAPTPLRLRVLRPDGTGWSGVRIDVATSDGNTPVCRSATTDQNGDAVIMGLCAAPTVWLRARGGGVRASSAR